MFIRSDTELPAHNIAMFSYSHMQSDTDGWATKGSLGFSISLWLDDGHPGPVMEPPTFWLKSLLSFWFSPDLPRWRPLPVPAESPAPVRHTDQLLQGVSEGGANTTTWWGRWGGGVGGSLCGSDLWQSLKNLTKIHQGLSHFGPSV